MQYVSLMLHRTQAVEGSQTRYIVGYTCTLHSRLHATVHAALYTAMHALLDTSMNAGVHGCLHGSRLHVLLGRGLKLLVLLWCALLCHSVQGLLRLLLLLLEHGGLPSHACCENVCTCGV